MLNRNSRPRYGRRRTNSWLRGQLAQRPRPVWMLIVMDLLLVAVSLVVFALFHHVLPRREDSTGVVSSRYGVEQQAAGYEADDEDEGDDLPVLTQSIEVGTSDEPETSGETEPEAPVEEPEVEETPEPEPTEAAPTGYFGDKFPDKFTDGQVIKTDSSYQSANLNITLNQYEYEGAVFYLADIYIRDIECFRTAFAEDKFGRGLTEMPVDINKRARGVVAVNGDYYGTRTDGVVIRNGELYRDKSLTMDVCALYWNGVMETYTRRQFDARKAMEAGCYQAWHFGPMLLDENGKPKTSFSNASIGPKNPRTVLGYYEPGHYCFVVVDGRSSDSDGLTIKVLAKLMSKLGCQRAYNMDGGATSMLLIGNKVVSHPYNGGRPSSDIILISDLT